MPLSFKMFCYQSAVAMLSVALLVSVLAIADEHSPAQPESASVLEITDEMINDDDRQQQGKALWQKQCRHCHGRSAYPGKAPKLKPRRYQADFVYDRITNGFRKMPAWKSVFSDEERIGLVAFIMGKNFAP